MSLDRCPVLKRSSNGEGGRAVHPHVVGVGGSAGFSPLRHLDGKNAPTSDAGEAALSRSGVNAALRYQQLRVATVAVLARLFQGHHTNGANPGIPASPRLPGRSDFAANPPASRRSST